MFITGLGTATPPKRYTQSECWDALVASGYLSRLNLRSRAILRKVLQGTNGICSRFLALEQRILARDREAPALGDGREELSAETRDTDELDLV